MTTLSISIDCYHQLLINCEWNQSMIDVINDYNQFNQQRSDKRLNETSFNTYTNTLNWMNRRWQRILIAIPETTNEETPETKGSDYWINACISFSSCLSGFTLTLCELVVKEYQLNELYTRKVMVWDLATIILDADWLHVLRLCMINRKTNCVNYSQ